MVAIYYMSLVVVAIHLHTVTKKQCHLKVLKKKTILSNTVQWSSRDLNMKTARRSDILSVTRLCWQSPFFLLILPN